MCTLFANLYVLLTCGPHKVYHGDPIWFTMGTPYMFHIYVIRCGWLGRNHIALLRMSTTTRNHRMLEDGNNNTS